MIGTGAISHKHAQAYKNIGFELTVCTDIFEAGGRKFADQYGCEFVSTYEEVCRHPKVDYVDVCTFPDFRMQPIAVCAETGKHVQVQKPISTNLETARQMVETARKAGIVLGVVSQHRFDDASLFLAKAHRGRAAGQAAAGRLLRQVVSLGRVLFAADQGELADGRRRRADQPGDPRRRYSAMAGRTGEGTLRCVAAGRAAQDRIGGRDQYGVEVRERRYRRDSGIDGVLAGVYGAHGIPRHEGHRDYLRATSSPRGMWRTIRAKRRRWPRKSSRARATRWRFRSSRSNASFWILGTRLRRAANRWCRVRKACRRWRLSTRFTGRAGRGRR